MGMSNNCKECTNRLNAEYRLKNKAKIIND